MRSLGGAIDAQTFAGCEWVRVARIGSPVSLGAGGAFVGILLPTLQASSAKLSALSADANSPLVADNAPGLYLVTLALTWGGILGGRRLIRLMSINVEVERNEVGPPPGGTTFTQSVTWLHYQGGPGGRLQPQAFTDISGASITEAKMTVARLASSS